MHSLDFAYNPRLSAHDLDASFAHWAQASQRTREQLRCDLDVPYGSLPSEKLDIFHAPERPRALLFFIHGGYWRTLDKRDNSFIANAVHQAGATVVLPNYALCPAVNIADIVMQMIKAAAWTQRNATQLRVRADRLYVAGHSAGGHLCAMLLAAQFDSYAADLPRQLFQAGLSISGLYDLRPLVHAPFLRNDIRLNDERAAKVSPALMPPAGTAKLFTAVGGAEPEGFQFQHELIGRRWKKTVRDSVRLAGHDHFTILSQLDNPASEMSRLLRKMMRID